MQCSSCLNFAINCAKIEREDSHCIQLWEQCIGDDSYYSKWHAWPCFCQRKTQWSSGLELQSWRQQWLSLARHSRSRNCFCTVHARQGVGAGGGGGLGFGRLGSMYSSDVCSVPSYLWIEFSACLERCLLKHRTTVTLSYLASRPTARVEPINLSRV